MTFTVLGAGAMGTLYAAKLAEAGHTVTVVARGARRETVERLGLLLRHRRTGRLLSIRVPVVGRLGDAPPSDFVLVFLRTQQLDAVLDELGALPTTSCVVTLVNTARGYGAWRDRLGQRLVAAFPGAAATLDGEGLLTWELPPRLVQPTVVGELDGTRSARVMQLASALAGAGFPTQVRPDLERWIRTHAAWICPFLLTAARGAAALRERRLLRLWMQATQEALGIARQTGRLRPFVFRVLAALPVALLTTLVRLVLRSSSLRAQIAATGAPLADEGRALAHELLADQPDSSHPALRALCAPLDSMSASGRQ